MDKKCFWVDPIFLTDANKRWLDSVRTPLWLITQPSKHAISNQSALSLSYKFINTHLQILFGFTGDYKEIILRVLYQLVFQI